MAMDSAGNLYIADQNNHAIRKVDANGFITTVAGNGTQGYSGDGYPATSAQLNHPARVAVDRVGNLYIADTLNNRIRKVNLSGTITTVARSGTPGIPGYSGHNGQATKPHISFPWGVAMDSAGDLYIADYGNHVIRKVDTNGIITTVAGNGTAGYSGDGYSGTSAQIYDPNDVAVDSAGNLYIADGYINNRVRKVYTSGIITTVAGSGTPGIAGYSGDSGPATSAQLNGPFGVALDSAGNLYIADTDNS